jgi:hypothetical protein
VIERVEGGGGGEEKKGEGKHGNAMWRLLHRSHLPELSFPRLV